MRAPRTMPDWDRTRSGELPDADRAVTTLYLTHYRPLVRVAALLVQDLAMAEEIVSRPLSRESYRARPIGSKPCSR